VIKKRNAVKSTKPKAMPARNVQNLNKLLGICFFFFQFYSPVFSQEKDHVELHISKVFTGDYRTLNVFSTLQFSCQFKKLELSVGVGRSIKSIYVTGGKEFYFENQIAYKIPISKNIFVAPQFYLSWENESRLLNYSSINFLGGVAFCFSFHQNWVIFQGFRLGINDFVIASNGERLSNRQSNYQSHIGIRYAF